MKLTQMLLVIIVGIFASTANSAITYGSNDVGSLYVGAKVGLSDADIGNSKAISYGVFGGYNFDQNLGAELELTSSLEKKYTIGSQSYEYDISGMGAYGTYRYFFEGIPLYAKGKVGIATTDIDNKASDGSYVNKIDKIGLGYGVGVGYQMGKIGVEATYSRTNGEVGTLAAGASMMF